MHTLSRDKKAILERIRCRDLSPEEGSALLRSLGSRPSASPAAAGTDIAVIGMAGRFPKARDLREYWDNLLEGRDCVSEPPADRWDAGAIYDPDPAAAGKTYCRWNGFIPDSDCFDPLFFNISPKEAELMDPQQRLFLEESWHAIENAGYTPEDLAACRTGVYAGVMQSDYARSGAALDTQLITGTGNCFLPARVSYFLNLTGPCLAIDTACSSSLVAIHQACQALTNGEIDVALAGGVSVIATPSHNIANARSEMLARDGRCKSFDNAADGFVPSEGAGVLVLKPLKRALEDRDYVYGVIRSSRVNHDGRTNGITAPSAESQAKLIAETYRACGIDPAGIGYVEAHGTGTKLGDPIEFSALTRAFRQFTDKREYCALGSVKSNIGHALAAAGVAGLIKALLCLRYDRLVPTIHFSHPNEHIDLGNSPFVIQRHAADWPRGENPRLAAISSFGLSGTNCHMVVSEPPLAGARSAPPDTALVVLSACDERALAARIEDLLLWLKEEGARASIQDIAFTLAAGRRHFPWRVAIVARSQADLQSTLAALAKGETPPNSWTKRLRKNGAAIARGAGAEDEFARLARRYVEGETLPWADIPGGTSASRVPLPGYPFARERYWLAPPSNTGSAAGEPGGRVLHPLVHRNVSAFGRQEFVTRFTGSEPEIAQHVVSGLRIMPAACYLEMARAGAAFSGDRPIRALRDVVWPSPFIAGEPRAVVLSLFQQGDSIGFEVAEKAETSWVVHARGYAEPGEEGAMPPGLDLAEIAGRCPDSRDGESLYKAFAEAGIVYGASYRAISRILRGTGECLALLAPPTGSMAARDNAAAYSSGLSPFILDAVLQSVAGVPGQTQLYLPTALNRLEWRDDALPADACVHASLTGRQSDGSLSFDIVMSDSLGRPALCCRGFTVRPVKTDQISPTGRIPAPSAERSER